MCEVGDLKVEEALDGLDISAASLHGLTDSLEHVADTCLHVLQLVLGNLAVEIRKTRDWADSSEDGVVTNEWRTRSEGCDHSDTFLGTESTKSLVLDVATLQDDSAALGVIVSLRCDKGLFYDNIPLMDHEPS